MSTEVPVGSANGLDHESVISCDNIVTIPAATLGRHLGYLLPAQEPALAEAIRSAYGLE
ncbi:mRNA-degrading endonuclease toxin of MazEF toxin-antitoxin module [Saccharopolyspora lacisalsi]|uniref:mRNA-degrading endonuclease toxin of MazEF toxin-antitoxin module n=1 Tax=Halosaccharopolyspora lacisalsi TaxID=1000566 RepID=A0A839DP56_9PSEU|nr:mRNA-degrading endonuclease toxin of MazEF toxin-antitoxin module [Halosaccharopolyspora lacisalsi]